MDEVVFTWFDDSTPNKLMLYAVTAVKPYPGGQVRLIWESTNSFNLRGTIWHWSNGTTTRFQDMDGSIVPVDPINTVKRMNGGTRELVEAVDRFSFSWQDRLNQNHTLHLVGFQPKDNPGLLQSTEVESPMEILGTLRSK